MSLFDISVEWYNFIIMGTTIEERAACEAGADLQKIRLQALEKAGCTFQKIVKEFASIAFSNIKDYVKIADGGELQAIPLDTISTKKLKAVQSIKEKTNIAESKDGETLFKTSKVEYKLYDKVEVLKYLCKLRGDEPAEKHEMSGAVIVMRPDPIVKPKDAGKGSAE